MGRSCLVTSVCGRCGLPLRCCASLGLPMQNRTLTLRTCFRKAFAGGVKQVTSWDLKVPSCALGHRSRKAPAQNRAWQRAAQAVSEADAARNVEGAAAVRTSLMVSLRLAACKTERTLQMHVTALLACCQGESVTVLQQRSVSLVRGSNSIIICQETKELQGAAEGPSGGWRAGRGGRPAAAPVRAAPRARRSHCADRRAVAGGPGRLRCGCSERRPLQRAALLGKSQSQCACELPFTVCQTWPLCLLGRFAPHSTGLGHRVG